MTKEEIIKYVLSSPENTNPNVLEGMLEELDGTGNNDFQIANLTIESSVLLPTIQCIIIYEDLELNMTYTTQTTFEEAGIYKIPIYKDGAALFIDTNNYIVPASIKISGSILDLGDDSSYIIYGDGTI